MEKLKKIPKFNSEVEERKFWETHDSTEYVDWSKARRGILFPNLKPTSRPITIRIPTGVLELVKVKANKMDIPYQALIKKLIFDGITHQ
jgi:predicted DNA binding CopG/RHH family protein